MHAVHLYIIEGYSTKDFLDGLRIFISIQGCPKEIYSDAGIQLNAANKELKSLSNWGSNGMQDFACSKGEEIKWIFNASADAPWQNGASESLIKSLKKCLAVAIGDSILTFSKLQTTLFEIGNIFNERPIGIKPGCDPEFGRYLCSNDLLLGRTSNETPKGVFEYFPSHESRLKFYQHIVNSFWKKWIRDFFPILLIRQKWHTERRNLQIGDLVLFQDSNVVRGTWKFAEITLAEKGKDGRVLPLGTRQRRLVLSRREERMYS